MLKHKNVMVAKIDCHPVLMLFHMSLHIRKMLQFVKGTKINDIIIGDF